MKCKTKYLFWGNPSVCWDEPSACWPCSCWCSSPWTPSPPAASPSEPDCPPGVDRTCRSAPGCWSGRPRCWCCSSGSRTWWDWRRGRGRSSSLELYNEGLNSDSRGFLLKRRYHRRSLTISRNNCVLERFLNIGLFYDLRKGGTEGPKPFPRRIKWTNLSLRLSMVGSWDDNWYCQQVYLKHFLGKYLNGLTESQDSSLYSKMNLSSSSVCDTAWRRKGGGSIWVVIVIFLVTTFQTDGILEPGAGMWAYNEHLEQPQYSY